MQTFLLAIAALALVMTALTAAELRQHVTGAKGERQQADADAIRNHGGYDRGRRYRGMGAGARRRAGAIGTMGAAAGASGMTVCNCNVLTHRGHSGRPCNEPAVA
jgi:hypothetical protein